MQTQTINNFSSIIGLTFYERTNPLQKIFKDIIVAYLSRFNFFGACQGNLLVLNKLIDPLVKFYKG